MGLRRAELLGGGDAVASATVPPLTPSRNEFAVLPITQTSALFDGDMQQAFKAFGVALRARISQLPATCLTWPDPADDDADDLIPDFPPGGGDDEIHVFHHMSSIELENYTPV